MPSEVRRRILMVIPELGYGGAEGSFLRVASHLSRHADVTIALMARGYEGQGYTDASPQTHLPIVLLDDGRKAGTSVIAKLFRWGRMLRRLRALKRDHDAAISFLSGANLLNALAGPSGKTIVSERGSKRFASGASSAQRLLWTRVLDPLTYRRSVKIVTASAGLAEEISADHPDLAQRITAIEGTISTAKLIDSADAEVESDFKPFVDYPTVVTFGRLHTGKGIDFLLRAFADVQTNLPSARLLLIGDGPELDNLLALAQQLGLRAGTRVEPHDFDVVFAGYRQNPHRYLRLGRVFCFTSRYEGLPNALIEGLAAGVPVLASDCPWGPRSILSGPGDDKGAGENKAPMRLRHGTLMPHPDEAGAVQVWSRAIFKLLSAPAERRSLEERRAAIARFDIESTGPRWMDMISEVVERQGGGVGRKT